MSSPDASTPEVQRSASQRDRLYLFSTFSSGVGSATAERIPATTTPRAHCVHCKQWIGTTRWTTGLCDSCYDASEKACRWCSKKLAVKQLLLLSGLCDDCYHASEKV